MSRKKPEVASVAMDGEQLATKARANEAIWVDRIARELRSQREYSQRWGKLSDPKSFADVPGDPHRCQKLLDDGAPSAWSPWFPRNAPPPKNARPPSAGGFVPSTYKITSAPAPADRAREANRQMQAAISGPGASSADRRHLTSLHDRSFNDTLITVRARAKLPPQQKYYYPPTHGEEYGWVWTRPSLEIYGRTFAQPSAQTTPTPAPAAPVQRARRPNPRTRQ